MRNENMMIIEALMFLEKAPFKERKSYMKDYYGEGVEINGFIIQRDVWCWIIWKPTDFEKNPEYKGDPLYKVVPENINFDNIGIVLDAQPWTYN